MSTMLETKFKAGGGLQPGPSGRLLEQTTPEAFDENRELCQIRIRGKETSKGLQAHKYNENLNYRVLSL